MIDTKKKYGRTEDEIMALVDPKVSRSTSWVDTQLSSERSRMQRYYDGTLPKRQHEGSSSYVSSDVYDGVESMKSQLLEVFAGGHDIIRFKPLNDADVDVVRVETAYVSHLFFDKCHGLHVLSDTIDDSLKNRNGVVQYYWETEVVRDEHTFERMPMDDVQALAAQDDIEIDATYDEDSYEQPTYSGTWARIIDKSGLRVEVVPPEEYFSEGGKKRRQDGVRGRKTLKSRADLIDEGYPKAKVDKVPQSTNLELDSERQTRDKETNDYGVRNDPVQPELEDVLVFETYVKLAMPVNKRKGGARLYRIIHAGGVMFEMDEVEEDNFLEFTPLRRPHSQFGNNFAKKIVPTQNARTVLTRAILDHTATTTNPRWTVLNNSLTNPKELLENRMRGIVNVKNRDAIGVLPYPNMNPFAFQTIEMLKSNKEETTGVSELSQGLDKDAISHQNSKELVGTLITVSQTRQKIIARNFALFMADLFQACRKLVLQNAKRKDVFEFDNTFQNVDPRLWTPTREVQVSLHVGYGEQEKEAAKYAQLWGMLSNDPKASLFCPPDKQYKLLTDGMKKNGFANVADYLITPDKVQPPGPDPLKMKELEIEDKKAQAALLQAQAAMTKVTGHQEIDMLKAQVNMLVAEVKRFTAERDADRKDMDIANKVNVSQREVELLENPPPGADERAIISPS
jgi:hypothetical protein